MRTSRLKFAFAVATASGAVLLPAAAAATPTPSPGAAVVNLAGTTFLTATAVNPGQPINVKAATGDYLYWSFPASTGQTVEISLVVRRGERERHGMSTWTLDVFDGLRRRQACTAGAQTLTVPDNESTVALSCTLRQVRGWAEPWSADPLPGTYYVRLATTDLPEADLGLPLQVEMLIGAQDGPDPGVEGGTLNAPLAAPVRPGAVLAEDVQPTVSAAPSPSPTAPTDDAVLVSLDWLPGLSERWVWTSLGGLLAAVAGIVGFSLTRRPRA